MALFPSENVRPEEEAIRRRAVTQETGTRRLVVGFLALLVLWFIISKIWDGYLLRMHWPALAPDPQGLTVVGTLDRRDSYDRNLFRIVHIEGAARAEVTSFGWDSIFSGQHGPLTEAGIGNTIRGAISLDGETGYEMLAPFLAAEVKLEMGDPHAFDLLSDKLPIETSNPLMSKATTRKRIPLRPKSLRELVDYFGGAVSDSRVGEARESGDGSESQHQVDHGLAIPGNILVQTCPIVLTGRHFASGSVEVHPQTIAATTYSVWLGLTPEGRSRFYQWSRSHVNEHLLLVLNGEVVSNGKVAMTMDVPTWEITNLKDVDAARKLVDFINSQHSGPK